MPQMDLGEGRWIDTDSGTTGGGVHDEYGNLPASRQATPEELAGPQSYFNSPEYASGRSTAEAQARASKKGGLFGGGGLGLMLALAAMAYGMPGGDFGLGASGFADAAAFEGAGGIDFMTGLASNAGGAGAFAMPAAIPETAEALTAQGLTQTGPGAWSDLGNVGKFAGDAFNTGGGSGVGSGGGEGVPVEERSRLFNPATSGGMPNFSNMMNAMMKNGNIGLPTTGKTVGGLPWNMISGGMDIGSGILGLMQKKKMQDIATQAFGRYSDRGDPYARVKALMANPGSVSSQPGYQFGMDEGRRAIARTGAAGGSGGNEAIALSRYTPEYAQNFYNNEVARLMQLGQGEGALGTAEAGIGLNAQAGADRLMSSSLGSIGYGANRMMGGAPNDMMMKMLMSAFR